MPDDTDRPGRWRRLLDAITVWLESSPERSQQRIGLDLADERKISRAVATGIAQARGVPDRRVMMMATAIIILIPGILVPWLHSHRSPVTVDVSAADSGDSIHVEGTEARLFLSSGARIVEYTDASSAPIRFLLPISKSSCASFAELLNSECEKEDTVSLEGPGSLTWPRATAMSIAVEDLGRRGVDIQAEDEVLVLSIHGKDTPPTVTFSQAEEFVDIITAGRLDHRWNFERPGILFDGTRSLPLTVSPGGDPAQDPSLLEIRDFSHLLINGEDVNRVAVGVRGMESTLVVRGLLQPLGSEATLDLTSDGTLSVEVSQAEDNLTLRVSSPSATSVIVNGGQLVPSAWDRDSGLWSALLVIYVTVLLAPLVSIAIRQWVAP